MEFIFSLDNSISSELCKEIINKFEMDDRKYKGKVGSGDDIRFKPDIKDTTDLQIGGFEDWKDIDFQLWSSLNKGIRKYFKYLLKNSKKFAEDIEEYEVIKNLYKNNIFNNSFDTGYQIQRVDKGGKFAWHHDSDNSRDFKRNIAYIWYLNTLTEEDGGSTKFFGHKITPKEGRLIMFPSTWSYLHTGTKVLTDKSKYIITGFLGEKLF